MTSKDAHLYNSRPANLRHGKEISSANSLAFTSQLASLIQTAPAISRGDAAKSKPKTTSARLRPGKEDIFHAKPKHKSLHKDAASRDHIPDRKSSKRSRLSQRDDVTTPREQTHTTEGESLDRGLWAASQKKMREKARLYAAMQRGEVEIEGAEEKYAVDFDQKWAQRRKGGGEHSDSEHEGDTSDSANEDAAGDAAGKGNDEEEEQVQYTDEFGRARTGTRLDALRAETAISRSQGTSHSYHDTSSHSGPTNVIRGDTIQTHAWAPTAPIQDAMESLARKRDRSLTPPEEQHFDSRREIRNHGTGFFRFSGDAEARKREMEGLEAERAETERIRRERAGRKADDFLEELGKEIGGGRSGETEDG